MPFYLLLQKAHTLGEKCILHTAALGDGPYRVCESHLNSRNGHQRVREKVEAVSRSLVALWFGSGDK